MCEQILRLESDAVDHSGVEIDQHLSALALHRGVSASDLAEMHTTNRSVFLNEVDWVKAAMTRDKLHSVVRSIRAAAGEGKRGKCNVYRIAQGGVERLDALEGPRAGSTQPPNMMPGA